MSKTISPAGARPAGVAGPRPAPRTREKQGIPWGRVAAWAAMILLLFVSLFPFFWMLRTALSSNADLVKGSQTLAPPGATTVNLKQVLGLASDAEIAKAGTATSTQ